REGKYRGGSIANFIAEAGAAYVEISTPLWSVCEDINERIKPEMYKLFAKNDVFLSPNQTLFNRGDGCLIQRNMWSGQERILDEIDLFVFIGYEEGMNNLFEELTSTSPALDVEIIGSALSPRSLSDAIHEGVQFGATL